MRNPLLDIKNLSIAFRHNKNFIPVVSNLDLKISVGQCVGLVGESGSGKSLTSLAVMQLLPLAARVTSSSQIFFNNHDILNFSERAMRKVRGHQIGMIFQDAMSAFNPVLTIGKQLMEVTHNRLAAYRALEEVGIDDVVRCFRAYPHELSGGMRQRAMIAMAICGNPQLIIADEPTTALDVSIQAQVLALLSDLKNKKNIPLLFISHDLSVVGQLADEIIVLQKGKIVEEATTHQFFSAPQQAYSKKLLSALLPLTPRRLNLESSPPILEVKQLKVYFPIRSAFLRRTIDNVKAVDDVSFTIQKGKTLALVGESGSGKTTIARTIANLIKPTGGEIIFNGRNLLTLPKQAMRSVRSEIQIIFQDPYAALDPRMTILDSMVEGLLAQQKVATRAEAIPVIDHWLEQVHLSKESKWRYPHEFSGGQRQRICIARALVLEPQLLILDEPTSALDVSNQIQILQLLEALQRQFNLTYLLITHNLSVVAYMAHYTAVMLNGKLVEQGFSKKFSANPKIPTPKVY